MSDDVIEAEETQTEKPQDAKLADVLDRLSSVISAKLSPPAPVVQQEKVWSGAELNDAVLTGQMTQATADAIADRQRDAHTVAVAQNAVQAHNAIQSVADEITKFKALVPNIIVEGSPEHKRLAEEYRRQVGRGLPETIATELVALEIVFGKASALEAAKNPKRGAEHHQDVGGGSGDTPKDKGPLAKLPAHRREHYQRMIAKNVYSGENDPDLLAELKYIKAA